MNLRAHGTRSALVLTATVALVATMTAGTASARPVIPDPGPARDLKAGLIAATVDDIGRSMAAVDAAVEAAEPAAERPGAAPLMAAADAALEPCPDDDLVLCGTVPVPLDRRNPDGRVVNIHIEVFPHTGPEPEAEGAVFVTCGGPGCSITYRFAPGFGRGHANAFFVLPEVWQTRDLVFVDQRGVGQSDVIDCPTLLIGGPFYESAAECHDSLGDTANLYSTTDVADDLEDVRLALGYGKVDLLGASYAGADMITYAVRHPESVRSVVLSSPAVVVGTDPFYPYAPEAMPRIVEAVCASSPTCAQANRSPERTFEQLLRQLRRRPVEGVGIDSAGREHATTVTENLVTNFITYFNTSMGPGELTPAAAALRRGDPVPLLRLAADNDLADIFGPADPFDFSAGHSLARTCVDAELPFDRASSPAERQAQYDAAYAAEPDFYGPVSKQAWAAPGYEGFLPSPCIASAWEERPMYPEGATVSGIPTLVIGGEYDLPVPESVAQLATQVLTDSTYVGLRATGHDPHFTECGSALTQRFISTLEVGDTSCASEQPAFVWWTPGSFPTRLSQVPPAEQTSGPRARIDLRRLVTAAVWTALDSTQHNFIVPGDSVALRGGLVDFEGTDSECLVDSGRREVHQRRRRERDDGRRVLRQLLRG